MPKAAKPKRTPERKAAAPRPKRGTVAKKPGTKVAKANGGKASTRGQARRSGASAQPAIRRARVAARADFDAPVAGFFAKQPPHLRPILERLRQLVEAAAPDATASIKWGMPFYAIGKQMMCALAGFKSHVNLILSGPPGTFADPEGRLEGEARLRTLDDLPVSAVRGWLQAAAARARAGA